MVGDDTTRYTPQIFIRRAYTLTRLTAEFGSFAWSGPDADLVRSLLVDGGHGSFALTGPDADLRVGTLLPVDAGMFALTGPAAQFGLARHIDAAHAAFALTGPQTGLQRQLLVDGGHGAFVLAGQDADLLTANPPSRSFRGFTLSTANASSYTFTSHDIGTAATGRRVLVGGFGVGGSASTISTTIAGSAGANLVTAPVQFSSPGEVAIRQVDTGTTGDIVLTFNATESAAGAAVHACYDLTSSAAVDTGSGTGAFNDTLTAVNPGLAFAYSLLNPAAGSSWTNLTEDHDTVVESASQMSAASVETAATSINIQRSPSAANNNATMAVTLQ